MTTGTHVRPKSSTPRGDNNDSQPEAVEIDIEEDENDEAEIDESWPYCSFEKFMKYLEKREAELAEIKRLSGGSGEHA